MLRIGEFSKMSKTTIKTLRYYDEIELLKPDYVDSSSGYRFYSTGQLFQLHQIQSLRQVDLPIEQIRKILRGAEVAEILEAHRKELQDELTERQRQLSQLEFMLNYKEDFIMNYVATIKEIPACTVYSKKLTAPSYNSYFELIPAIGKQLEEKYPDFKCATPEYCYIVYLDGEYREADIHIEYCEAITQKYPNFDDISFKDVPPITAVSIMHKGPYGNLAEAYAFGIKWIEENGYQLNDNPRESYIDGIWNKENDADWLTELQFPIGKK